MKKKPTPESLLLRQKAEEKLKNTPPKKTSVLSEAASIRLIHELEVHQVELEMQYQELVLAKQLAADAANDKYAQLYDFAPTGYFTLNRSGEITMLNLRGAFLLGKGKSLLLNRLFSNFVTNDSKPVFDLFLDKVFNSVLKETCEVFLTGSDKNPLYVALYGITGEDYECLVTVVDITARWKSEEKLKASERFLKESQEIAMLGSYTIDFVAKSWFGSEMLYSVLGVDRDFIKTFEGWVSIIHPEWQQVMREYYTQDVLLNKNKFDKEYKIIRPDDKRERWVHGIGQLEFNEQNQPVKLIGIIRDISERKKAEEVVRESEERYRYMFANNPQPMWIFDAETLGFLEVNHAAVIHYGYSRAEFLSMTLKDIRPAEDIPALMEEVEIARKNHTPRGEWRHIKKSGEQIIVEITSHLINFNGRQAQHILINDITERKHADAELKASELKFRELFEANTDGITIFNISPEGPPSNIIDLNENAAKMVGYTREEMKLLTPNEFENDVVKEKIEKRMQDLSTKGYSDFETIIKHKDGHKINVEIKVMMINYHNQPAMMNIVRDITERKKTELLLQKYAVELSSQIAEKDKFFSIIAHDLRGPFSGFLELTNLMAEESSRMSVEDMKKIAGIIKKSATNLFRLLGNLLEWSSMQRGITKFNPRLYAFNSRLYEIKSIPQEAAFKKGIEINYDIPDDLLVFADENMLEAIIRNLTANAVKYTNTGGSITVSAKSFPDDSVEFSVKDTGIGMSKDILDNLFNIDVNTSRKGTSGELSTGLGLMICKDFVEKHKGTLRIESEKGIGSTFSFTLPGQQETDIQSGITMADSVVAPSVQLRKLNILIAEDEETSDLLISIALSKISREFFHAKTGVATIEILRNRPDIDLIMMDIQMPEMDGYEATRQIRLFNTDVIIIAQTAYTFSNERDKALKAGCNDYISKPISQSELLDIVGKYIK